MTHKGTQKTHAGPVIVAASLMMAATPLANGECPQSASRALTSMECGTQCVTGSTATGERGPDENVATLSVTVDTVRFLIRSPGRHSVTIQMP